MKHLHEFRNSDLIKKLLYLIKELKPDPCKIMEVCGGQTHSILKYGLNHWLPHQIELIHGPGCPVCVTPINIIDRAIELSLHPEVIFCTFGDMMRVPGTESDLHHAKARGGDIRLIYSPTECFDLAKAYPHKEIILFAIGFETTAPIHAAVVKKAKLENIKNFSLLVSHVLVPPALDFILSDKNHHIDALLAAGHVCSIMGLQEYLLLSQKFKLPIVATGFEPVDLLQGIYMALFQKKHGTIKTQNQYSRSVPFSGNHTAQALLKEVFQITDQEWRGIGVIPHSALKLNCSYEEFDSFRKFPIKNQTTLNTPSECISGQVMRGIKKPIECPHFGKTCQPSHPLGAPMVSSEGVCANYYLYHPREDLKNAF